MTDQQTISFSADPQTYRHWRVAYGGDSHGLEEVVAFVVSRSGHEIDSAVVDAYCRNLMASFKRPRRLFVVDSLPKTATGKIQRYALRAQLESALGN